MDVEKLRADARAWLAVQAATAPPDHGAIGPPELIGERLLGLPREPPVVSGAE